MEDTQKHEASIAEALRDADKAEIPSELKTNPVLQKGDVDTPRTIVREISGGGYVWVWDTRTLEKIPVLHYMLPAKLRQRRIDGSYRFTTNDPGKLPARGRIKCLLHQDSESRAHYDELGFRVCPKSNITNRYQLQQHMVKKHPQEWATIEQERKDAEKKEDRDFQRSLLAGVKGATVAEEFVCEDCKKSFTSRIALAGHKRTHSKKS